jgi:hypothetical protein
VSTQQVEAVRRDTTERRTSPPAAGPSAAASVGAGPDPAVDRTAVVEDRIKLAVLGAIMLAALAASFTHMHDWTMRWMPDGTPGWFGWANATISELVPLVATLSLRKRLHDGKKIWSYSLAILVAGAVLSLAAQLSAVGSQASWSARFLACLPSLAFLFLSKLVIGDLDANRVHAAGAAEAARKAAADTARWARQVREARAETEKVRGELAEMQTRAEAAAARAEAETAAREKAETRAAEAETAAAAAAESRAETERRARAEIARHESAVVAATERAREAEQHAGVQAQAARLAEGRLAEARESADRAAAARVAAEQRAGEHIRQVSAAAEQAEYQLRQQLAAATGQATAAERRAAELAEQVRTVQAQRDEARAVAEQQSTGRVLAEQALSAAQRDLQAAQAEQDRAREQWTAELARTREAAVNEIERLKRQLARATEKAEIAAAPRPEISRAPTRKQALVPAGGLVENLPVSVETVAAETVAVVLFAWSLDPAASQARLSELTGISDRTIRKVLRAIPADDADEIAAQVRALVAEQDGTSTTREDAHG